MHLLLQLSRPRLVSDGYAYTNNGKLVLIFVNPTLSGDMKNELWISCKNLLIFLKQGENNNQNSKNFQANFYFLVKNEYF